MIDPKLSREDSMTVKDILAIVDTGDEDEQFLKDAREFARFHDAHLTVAILSAVPTPDYAMAYAQPYFLLADYVEAVGKAGQGDQSRRAGRLRGAGSE
ncbi:hypothetical protein ACFSUK_05165 [Sphingobium scionense]